MTLRRLAISLVAACVLSAPAAWADDAPATRPAAAPAFDQEAHEAFEHHMHDAGDAWKALRGSPFDSSSREADLRNAQKLQAALVGSKANVHGVRVSPKAAERFGSDAAAFYDGLRKNILDVLSASIRLEDAVLTGDTAAAKAAFKTLEEQQKQAHGLFRRGKDNLGEQRGPEHAGDEHDGPGSHADHADHR